MFIKANTNPIRDPPIPPLIKVRIHFSFSLAGRDSPPGQYLFRGRRGQVSLTIGESALT